MKRVKYACLSQTIHFTLSEKIPHQDAVALAMKERQNCLEEMERRGVAHQVDRAYQLEDGTPVLRCASSTTTTRRAPIWSDRQAKISQAVSGQPAFFCAEPVLTGGCGA